MAPTVADVLDLPPVRSGSPQVLSAVGLQRSVRWVHSSDLPDLNNLLQGGELVLTTGAGLLAAPRRYIEGLATAGAVGVVVELPDPATTVPPAAVRAAEERGLALIVLRQEVRFVEITEHVHRNIVAAQYQEVDFARQVHEEFTDLTIRRATPAQIVDAATGLLDLPVVLEDLAHQAVAAATGGQDVDEVLADWERRSRLHGAGQQSARTALGQPGPDRIGDAGEALGLEKDADANSVQDWLVQPVGRGEDAWARLVCLPGPSGSMPGTSRRRATMVLDRAAQALTMHRMAERDEVSLVHQAQAGLIADVLQDRVRTEKEALIRAQALGMQPGAVYVPAAVLISAWQETDPLAAQKRQRRLLTVLTRTTGAEGHTGLFAAQSDGTIAMVLHLSTGSGNVDGMIDELGRALRRDAAHSLGAEGLVLAVSAARTGLVEAIGELAAAGHIAAVAATMPITEKVTFRTSDIRLRGLVALLRDDPRVLRFAETELRDLILDDLASGLDNIGLLRTYLEAGGNKTQVARRTHMSRPALYSRLARIEKVLGTDLSDGESRASLYFALLTLERRGQGYSVRWSSSGARPGVTRSGSTH